MVMAFVACIHHPPAARAQDKQPTPAAVVAEQPADQPPVPSWVESTNTRLAGIDKWFESYLVRPLAALLFFDFGSQRWAGGKIPFVVAWLFLGAVYFTFRMRWINVRGFWHAVRLTRGDYQKPHERGEVSHFQALASALSGTLGLGNISGVALAVAAGGPGAIVWLILTGIVGMSSKFAECTLGMLYRKFDRDGRVSGGPMHYLREGLAEIGRPGLGRGLAIVFAVLCIGGSFGGGCAFQVGQSLGAVSRQIPMLTSMPWLYGLVLAVLVGVVIIGGIRRIASVAELLVPFMCGLYILACFYILAIHADRIPGSIRLILTQAFQGQGIEGAWVGVMVQGIRRAAFSNEAGIGSASIAHSAARTDEPVSEGIVALLEPFIDTVVVCTITGLVIVVTGCHDQTDPLIASMAKDGAKLTSHAFATAGTVLPWLLAVAVFLFAYATIITWSYYGERCWSWLFGERSSLVYKLLMLAFVMLGAIVQQQNIIDFSDMMILSMALPNILGVALLSGKVRAALDDYWRRYKAGELEPRPPNAT